MGEQEHVYVAISGGVDSAVTAVKLLESGFRVTGIHMRVWQDPASQPDDADGNPVDFARSTADFLGIPFVSLDVRDKFYLDIIQPFITQYLAGQTPNPCLFCNPAVKWGILQAYAFTHGGDLFATGHYARIERMPSGKVRLLKALDRTKDQSYVLSMLSQAQLDRSCFPLGVMTKEDVRRKAEALNLPSANQPESQDLCFLGKGDYRAFLRRASPESFQPGEIVDIQGKVLGAHEGLALYTIGQRKGIRIAAAEPYFIADKDIRTNRLVVGFAGQVGKTSLDATRASWISGEPPEAGLAYDVMIRYRAAPKSGVLTMATNDNFRLEFKMQLRGVTPGQAAVLYRGKECLGGGVIQASG
jgi:tRNA-specific 2-thiouridylase